MRPRGAHVLCSGVMERPRSHPERAPFRAWGARGQPWRGCEGVLLLFGFNPHPLLHEGTLQIPAGGVSLCAAARGEQTAKPAAARVRAIGYRSFRTGSLLRHLRRIRQGGYRRHPDPHHRREQGTRGGHPSSAAYPLVSQYLVLGALGRRLLAESEVVPVGRTAHRGGARLAGEVSTRLRGRRRGSVYGERNELRAPLRFADGTAICQGFLPRLHHSWAAGGRESGRRGNEGGGLL